MKKNMNKLTLLTVFLGLAFAASVQAANVSVSLRFEDTLVLDNVSLELPLPGTVTITDSEGEDRSVNAKSALGVLALLDETDTSFEISRTQYFTAFDSLFLQCITITLLESEQCDNWLYAVDGVAPVVGMDEFLLTGEENVFFYFGPSHQVVLSTTTAIQGEPFEATAQNYQYQDNTWSVLDEVTIGFTQADLKNPLSPVEVLLAPVDLQGQVSLDLDIPLGDYDVGIKEDFYFPSVQLTVVAPQGAEVLSQDELDVLLAQIEIVTNEIAKVQAKILAVKQLELIEQKVLRIAEEVDALRPQVAALHAAYLAKLDQPQSQGLAREQQTDDEIAQFSALEDGAITLGQEPQSQEGQGDEQFTAEAAGSLQNFFRSSTGQAVLALGVGIILFLALGGWRAILSLVRRPRTVV